MKKIFYATALIALPSVVAAQDLFNENRFITNKAGYDGFVRLGNDSEFKRFTKHSLYRWSISDQQWERKAEKTTYTYDASGGISSFVRADSATNVFTDRSTYRVGNPFIITNEYWIAGEWVKGNRTTATKEDNVESDLLEVWNGSDWQTVERYEQIYNQYGHLIKWKNESHSSGKLGIESGRQEYIYPEDGGKRYSQYIIQKSLANGNYENSFKKTNIKWDSEEDQIYSEDYKWNGTEWLPYSRETIVYTSPRLATGLRDIEKVTEVFVNGVWKNKTRNKATYATRDNPLQTWLSEEWNGTTWRKVYANDWQHYLNEDGYSRAVIYKSYNLLSGEMENVYKHVYSDFQSFVLANKSNASAIGIVNMYPNPAKDQVTVNISGLHSAQLVQVTVFNSLGQQIDRRTIIPLRGSANVIVPVSHLLSGIYTLRISNQQGSVTRRLIRQ